MLNVIHLPDPYLFLDRGHDHDGNDGSGVLCCDRPPPGLHLYRAGCCDAKSGEWWGLLYHRLAFPPLRLRVCENGDDDVLDGALRGLDLLLIRRWWSDGGGNGDDGIDGGKGNEILLVSDFSVVSTSF